MSFQINVEVLSVWERFNAVLLGSFRNHPTCTIHQHQQSQVLEETSGLEEWCFLISSKFLMMICKSHSPKPVKKTKQKQKDPNKDTIMRLSSENTLNYKKYWIKARVCTSWKTELLRKIWKNIPPTHKKHVKPLPISYWWKSAPSKPIKTWHLVG